MAKNSRIPDQPGEIMAVDDTPANLQLLIDILTHAGYKVRPTKKPRVAIEAAQARPPDLILLDVKMPEMDGFEVCRHLKQDKRTRGIPIIFVSALQHIEDRVKGFEAGAVDFITKPYQKAEVLARIKTHMELRNIQKHLKSLVSERTAEIHEAYETIRKSEVKYKSLFNDALDMIHIVDRDGKFIDANPIELRTLGYSREEYIGRPLLDIIHPDDREKVAGALRRLFSGKTVKNSEATLVAKDGAPIYVEVNAVPQAEEGRILSARAIIRNITGRKREEEERKKLEDQLRQAQRLEAMGTLAGGIAHDFNNILTPILGYAEMTQEGLPPGNDFRKNQREIIYAACRAKDLVQQILAFSRQAEQERLPLKIHLIVKETLKLLRASIPTTIEIRQNIEATSGVVHADPTQIHQVVMNLCTNAYHAMQETGGILVVSLTSVEIDQDDVKIVGLALTPGRYLKLEVSDTGHGMDQGTLERIFEPYFSTKEKGKGTGLGLAIVHGIVKSHGGHITVYSEPGEGTTFHIYLPHVLSEVTKPGSEMKKPLPQGSERLLVVDDEESIVQMGQQMLESLGYEVTALTSSTEAWDMLRKQPGAFDLVITDMTMPNMTGVELAQRYLSIRPDGLIILSTGFSELINEQKARAVGIRQFIMKPVHKRDLAKAVRKVLDEQTS